MGRGDEAVPAPQIAFARHQPLAGLERSCELGAGLAIDHADLRQPARQLRRRLARSRDKRLRALAAAPDRRRRRRSSIQCIGAEASTGASRSSPSAAPSAFS